MARTAVKCTVAGRVQGVFYRASAAERAGALGLDGWVRNLPDGRVELVAAGEPEAIEQLAAWLWQGPPLAEVMAVAVEKWPGEIEPGFSVVRRPSAGDTT